MVGDNRTPSPSETEATMSSRQNITDVSGGSTSGVFVKKRESEPNKTLPAETVVLDEAMVITPYLAVPNRT
jgi:hypothetical protein